VLTGRRALNQIITVMQHKKKSIKHSTKLHYPITRDIIRQCKMQTVDCRLQSGDKMQNAGKGQNAECRP